MNDLPEGWVETTLGDVGIYMNGRAFKESEWRERGRPIIRIQNLTGSSLKVNYFDGEADDRHVARTGDLLVSWAATLGVFVWSGPEAVVNQHIFKVESLIDRDFHRYLLQNALADLQRQTHGSGMVHITKSRFDSTPVPLPPLPEQHRIVAAIEEQFSRLDAAEESLHRARRNLQRFRGAALSSAFDNGSPMTKIGEFARIGSGATPKRDRADYWGGSIPWVTSGQLSRDFVDEPAELITECALAETSLRLWPAGTLLVAMYGEGQTRGRCSELRFESTSNQACAAIVVDEEVVDRNYLKRFFAASYESNRRLASGGVQPNLSLGIIRDLEVPLPSLEDQRRIVAEVERQLSLIDAQAIAIDVALKRSASLRAAILERAFTGRLVPQDPSDEPASELLDRIRSERGPAKPKGARAVGRS